MSADVNKAYQTWINEHYPNANYVNALSIKWVQEFAKYYAKQYLEDNVNKEIDRIDKEIDYLNSQSIMDSSIKISALKQLLKQ